MFDAGSLIARLKLDKKQFDLMIKQAEDSVKKLSTRLSNLNFSLGGRKFFVAGAAMSTTLGLLTKKAADFEAELAQVSTMLDEGTMPLMKKYEKGLETLSIQFGESTKTLSEGLYNILSASIAPEKALDTLAVAARAATAGITDTGTAAKAIVTILNSYGLGAEKAAMISDELFGIVKRGQTTFAELAPTIGMVAASAAKSGLRFEELGAAISTITRAGMETTHAIVGINNMLIAFLKPQEEAVKVAKQFGLELNTNTLRTIGLTGVMKKLKDASAEQLAQIFGNIRGLRGMVAALGDLEGYTKDYNLMLNSVGLTQAAFNKQVDTARFLFNQAKQALNALAVMLGNKLLPAVKDFLTNMITTVKEMMNWINLHPRLTKALVKLAEAIAIVTTSLGALALGVAAVTTAGGPIIAVMLGVEAAILAVYEAAKHWEEIEAVALGVWDSIKDLSTKIRTEITTLWNWLKDKLKFDWIKERIVSIFISISDALKKIPLVSKLIDLVLKLLKKAKEVSSDVADVVKSKLSPAVEKAGSIVKKTTSIMKSDAKVVVGIVSDAANNIAGHVKKRLSEIDKKVKETGAKTKEVLIDSSNTAKVEVDKVSDSLSKLGDSVETVEEKVKEVNEGFINGFRSVVKEYGTSAEQMYETGKTFAQDMETSFRDYFFEAMKGNIRSLRDLWKGFCNSMVNSFLQAIANMMSKKVMASFASFLGSLFNIGSTAMAAAKAGGVSGGFSGALSGGIQSLLSKKTLGTLLGGANLSGALGFKGLSSIGGISSLDLGSIATLGTAMAGAAGLGYIGGKTINKLLGQHGKYGGAGGAAGAAIGFGLFGVPGALVGMAIGGALGGIGPDKYKHAGVYESKVTLTADNTVKAFGQAMPEMTKAMQKWEKSILDMPEWARKEFMPALEDVTEKVKKMSIDVYAESYRDIFSHVMAQESQLSSQLLKSLDEILQKFKEMQVQRLNDIRATTEQSINTLEQYTSRLSSIFGIAYGLSKGIPSYTTSIAKTKEEYKEALEYWKRQRESAVDYYESEIKKLEDIYPFLHGRGQLGAALRIGDLQKAYRAELSKIDAAINELTSTYETNIQSLSEEMQDFIKQRAEELSAFGVNILKNALSKGFSLSSIQEGFAAFSNMVRESLYNSIVQGIIDALMETSLYKRALVPLLETISDAFQIALTGETFNVTLFNSLIQPALASLGDVLTSMQPMFESAYNVMSQIRESLKLPALGTSTTGTSVGTTSLPYNPEASTVFTSQNIIHVTVEVDGKTLGDVIAEQYESNVNLQEVANGR